VETITAQSHPTKLELNRHRAHPIVLLMRWGVSESTAWQSYVRYARNAKSPDGGPRS